MRTDEPYTDALRLLKRLIATPSFSKEEDKTADLIENFLHEKNIESARLLNNVWAKNKFFDKEKPTIVLNSHHDTVRPNKAYTVDPFLPLEKDGKLFGLGSNDAGGSLVSLIAAFVYFYDRPDLKYNLVLAATAEEEISGTNGIEALLDDPQFISPEHSSSHLAGRILRAAPMSKTRRLLLVGASLKTGRTLEVSNCPPESGGQRYSAASAITRGVVP